MKKQKWKRYLAIGGCIFLLYLAIHYWPTVADILDSLFAAAIPLFLGVALAYVINLLMQMYKKIYFPKSKKPFLIRSRQPVCMTASVITLFAVTTLVVWLVVPQLISCISLLIDTAPSAIKSAVAFLESKNLLSEEVYQFLRNIDWQSKINELFNFLSNGIGNVMDAVMSAVSSVVSGIVTSIIALIFACYLLAAKDKLRTQACRMIDNYCKPAFAKRIVYVAGLAHRCFGGYILGQFGQALRVGLACLLGMLIFQMPYTPMITALVAFTALIPVVGAYVGGGLGAFILLLEDPIKALIFLALILVIQIVEGNLLYPRFVGSTLGLPPIWILVAVTLGGGLFGIWGMLLSVPLAATIYHILRNDLHKKESAKKTDLAESETDSPEIAAEISQ